MTTAPNVKLLLYWDFIEQEAALIGTDGCSKATGAFRRHCRVHDLSYYFAKDPISAYRHYVAGVLDYWGAADDIDQATADANLRKGMQSDSPLGFFSPLAILRWTVLKAVGKNAWNSHRQRETEALGV